MQPCRWHELSCHVRRVKRCRGPVVRHPIRTPALPFQSETRRGTSQDQKGHIPPYSLRGARFIAAFAFRGPFLPSVPRPVSLPLFPSSPQPAPRVIGLEGGSGETGVSPARHPRQPVPRPPTVFPFLPFCPSAWKPGPERPTRTSQARRRRADMPPAPASALGYPRRASSLQSAPPSSHSSRAEKSPDFFKFSQPKPHPSLTKRTRYPYLSKIP
jgi:hypothetical protein